MAFEKNALASAALEQIEAEITGWIAGTEAAALTDEGVIGTIALIISSVPKTVTGTVTRFIAEKIEHSSLGNPVARHTMASILRGVVDGIEEFNRKHCTSEEACRNELLRRWREKKTATPTIGFANSPKPPSAPPDFNKVVGSYPEASRDLVYALSGVFRRESTIGVDIVPEIEGEAGNSLMGLFEGVDKAPLEILEEVRRVLPGASGPLKDYRDWQMRRIPAAEAASDVEVEQEVSKHARRLVRASIPLIDALTTGYARRHPNPASVTAILGFADRVNAFAGTSPNGMRQKLAKVRETAEQVADVSLKVTALSMLWAGGMLVFAYLIPTWTFEATCISFVVLLVGTSIAVFKKGSKEVRQPDGRIELKETNATARRVAAVIFSGVIGMLAIAYGFFIAIFADTMPVPDELRPYMQLVPITGFHYIAAVFCMTALILWNHVSLAGMQESVHGAGATKRLIKSMINDEGEAATVAEILKKNMFFSKLGYTVLGAVGAIIFIPIVTWLIGLGPVMRGVITFLGVVLAITTSNIGSHIVAKWGLGDAVKKVAEKDYGRVANLRFVLPGVLIAAFAIFAIFGVTWAIGLRDRASHLGAKAVEQIDEATGYSGASSTTRSTSSSASGGTKSCADYSATTRKALCAKRGKCCE